LERECGRAAKESGQQEKGRVGWEGRGRVGGYERERKRGGGGTELVKKVIGSHLI
jgi:hypothetical protein